MSCQPPLQPIGLFDFALPIGSFYELPLTWSAYEEPESLTDFTGATAVIEIRELNETGVIVLTLTTENGGIVIDETEMKAVFDVESTAGLRNVRHRYFWRVTMPGQEQQTLLKGVVTPIFA
jgi:hypothetical protein